MSGFLLDTNVPSELTRPKCDPKVEAWLEGGMLAGQSLLGGKTIKVADGLIAATALHHDLTIVTRNVKDFE